MKVINLFGGPGTGKSTTAAGLFHIMKLRECNVELVTEYAKDLTWEKRHDVLGDQLYILAKQARRLTRLDGQVDFVVTDSPLLLGLIYQQDTYFPNTFAPFLLDVWNSFDNINFLLRRVKKYNPIGRNQTEEGAKEIDGDVERMLKMYRIGNMVLPADPNTPEEIFRNINA